MGERRQRVRDDRAGRRAADAGRGRQDHATGLLLHQGQARGAGHGVTTSTERQTRGYTDIGGHRTWFADSGGAGEPVLLLPGGVEDSWVFFSSLRPPPSPTFTVVPVVHPGHR